MGRSLNSGAGGGAIAPYIPGRLYGLPGLAGAGMSRTGLAIQPLRLRPGEWMLTGLWAVIGAGGASTAGGTVRLGLYADAAGRPGALIKDGGTVTLANRGLARVTFDPVLVGAPDGLDVHFAAVATGGLYMGEAGLYSEGATDEDWIAIYGLDPAAAPAHIPNTGWPSLPRSLMMAGASPATPLSPSPNLAGATSGGAIYGGLIFG